MFSDFLESLSYFIFSGFLALFIMPQVLYRLFYYIPNCIRFALNKKMTWGGFKNSLGEVAKWLGIVSALIIISYFVNKESCYLLLWGSGAKIAWCLGFINVGYTVLFHKTKLMDDFYEKIFYPYCTDAFKSEYEEFISILSILYPNDTYALLEEENLSYLHKKAIYNKLNSPQTPF